MFKEENSTTSKQAAPAATATNACFRSRGADAMPHHTHNTRCGTPVQQIEHATLHYHLNTGASTARLGSTARELHDQLARSWALESIEAADGELEVD